MLFSVELLELWASRLRPLASSLRPPASYRMLLENSMPTACYFQRNSWKFEGSLIEVIIDLWPLFWGIMMLKQQKKCICAASERLLIRWSKLLALLCLGRTYIFFDLDCQASVYCPASVWLSTRGRRPRLDSRPWLDTLPDLRKWKFSHDKETSLSSFVTFWASLQRQHRTFIIKRKFDTLNISQ